MKWVLWRRQVLLFIGAIGSIYTPAFAQAQDPLPSFEIPQAGVAFSTGDTWTQDGQVMRLYGVQACLRGTTFTNRAGVKTDCGEASLAYFAALVRDTKPRCAPVAKIDQPPAVLVVCSAHIGAATLDLGTILITEGFAFAAFDNAAKPVYMPYLVAEILAKQSKAGLWAAPDLPHPNTILLRAVGGRH
jgi:endonuclease YncB( thermonuclease family)